MQEYKTTEKLQGENQPGNRRIKACADRLQAISEQLSRKSKIILLVLFMLTATATWLLLAFSGSSRPIPGTGSIQQPILPEIRERIAPPGSTEVTDTINNHKK